MSKLVTPRIKLKFIPKTKSFSTYCIDQVTVRNPDNHRITHLHEILLPIIIGRKLGHL